MIGEDQKKSSHFDLRFLIGGGNLVGDQCWIRRGGPNLKLQSGDQTSKTTKQKSSQAEELNCSRKSGENQKKGGVFTALGQGENQT